MTRTSTPILLLYIYNIYRKGTNSSSYHEAHIPVVIQYKPCRGEGVFALYMSRGRKKLYATREKEKRAREEERVRRAHSLFAQAQFY